MNPHRHHLIPSTHALAAFALAGSLLLATAHAQWTGAAGTSDWDNPLNWTGNTLPNASTNINPFDPQAAPHPVISSGLWEIAGITTQGVGISSTLTIQGTGTLRVGTSQTRFGGAANTVSYLNLSDNGYISFAATNLDFGNNGTVHVNLSGNSVMEHLAATGATNFGMSGAARASVTLKDNARWIINSSAANALGVGYNAGSGGGLVTIQDSATVSLLNGGVEMGRSSVYANSEIVLTSANAASRATLATKLGIQSSGAAGTARLIFDGGLLQALGGRTDFIRGNIAITTTGQGAFIDSNGFDIGIASTVTFAGAGGLTKLGQGALTLNNIVACTGATDVQAGSLGLTLANQLAGSSSITVADGASISSIFAQTFNNLSGAGAIALGFSSATFDNATDTVFSGNLTAGSITKTGAGSLTLSGNNTLTGDLALNGGMLVIGSASAIGAGTGRAISITSGTLGGTAASLMLAHAITAQSGVQVAIDAGTDSRMEFTGAITGDTGVNKTGSGDLVLSGNLSGLSGPLTINQGGLFTTDYTGNVTIADGAAFGGAGTITGDVTFTGAGSLQAGLTHNDATLTTSSTLTITGALNFGGAATLSHDMYASGNDTIIAGSASFGATGNSIDLVNIQSGTYTLFKVQSGTINDSFLTGLTITQNGGAALDSTRATASAVLNADKTEIQILSDKTNQVLTWTGATDANWDSTTDNWAGLDTKFVSGDKIIFNATGDNAIAIMPTGAVVSEMSITGDGSHTFTGGALTVDANSTGVLGTSFGGAAPTGVFTIDTTGTVTLANSTPNNFTNGIDVRQGTLIGSVAHFGDADIATDGATIFNQTANATYTGILTGTGVLGKTGAGTLTVGNNLAGFTGRTELAGGTLTFSASVTYNSTSITGSNANVTAGADFIFAGDTTLTNGSFTTGANAQVGQITINGTGGITTGNNSTIAGPAATGTGNIAIGNDSVINGSATAASGTINIGTNSTIQGPAIVQGTGAIVVGGTSTISGSASVGTGNITLGNNSVINGSATAVSGTITIGANSAIQGPAVVQGVGAIVVGGTSVISGSASVGAGFISVGAQSVLDGPATVTGSGGVWLGAGGAINGSVHVQTGTLFLSANSHIDGPVTSAGASLPIFLLEGSKINGSVNVAGMAPIYLSTGTLVITNTTFPIDGGEPIVTSTTQSNPSRIAGDVTINGPLAYVRGAGIIDGTVHVTDPSAHVLIEPARPYYVSGVYNRTFYDNVAVLKIGSIVLAGSGELRGSGTLVTDSVSFSGTLELSNGVDLNAFASGLTITGSLIGSGNVVKTGSGNVILEAASSYTGPTTVLAGSLIARAENALSPNSPLFHIYEGASLSLGGINHTLPEVINHGRIYIGGNNLPCAGVKLTITGPYDSGNTGGISFNIIAADNAKTLTDQLIFTNAANISGTTRVFVQFTDNRADWTRVVYDLDPIIIADAGELDPGMFVLDDGRGYERVVMSQRDYVIKYTDQGVELKATTAAEMPAALAANAVSIMASRAAYGSVTQRLDYLRAAPALPGNDDSTVQAWAQTYYRADKLDGSLFPDSDGTVWGFQAGVDKRNKNPKSPAYTTYGAFVDRNEASATLTNNTKTDLSSTGLGGYISARSPNNWHTDLVLRYSWDNYKITIGDTYKYKDGDQSMETKGYTWGALLRIAKHFDIANDWTLTPQTQLTYQQRKIQDTTDTYGRTYAFGPEDMRVNAPASFEFRLGAGIRKLITINETIALAPYLNAHFLNEFKGSLSIQTVNNAFVREDFGGSSWLFTAGLPVRLSRRVDAYADVSLQTGGPITGHGFNLGINYRW